MTAPYYDGAAAYYGGAVLNTRFRRLAPSFCIATV
jgi:hypothetical protein